VKPSAHLCDRQLVAGLCLCGGAEEAGSLVPRHSTFCAPLTSGVTRGLRPYLNTPCDGE
jgi:hypothetical protein